MGTGIETLSNFDPLLKTRYLPGIVNAIENSTYFYSMFKKFNARMYSDVTGKNLTIPIVYGYNEAIGSRADNEQLPAAKSPSQTTATFGVKYSYGRLAISGPTLEASRDRAGAYADAMKHNVQLLEEGMKKNSNRELFSDGRGALAFKTDSTDSSPFNVTHAWDANHRTAFTTGLKSYARTNMSVDVIATSDNSTKLGNSIVLTSATNTAVAFTGSVSGSAAGDYLVREDTLGNEWTGLLGMVSDTNPPLANYGGINRSTAGNEYWQSPEISTTTTARDLTTELMDEGVDTCLTNQGGECDLIVTSVGLRRKYMQLLVGDKRFNSLTLDGGYKHKEEPKSFRTVTFNDMIPVVAEVDCPPNIMFFLDKSTFAMATLRDWKFKEDKYGNILWNVTDYDRYEATLTLYGIPICNQPGKNAFLDFLNQ